MERPPGHIFTSHISLMSAVLTCWNRTSMSNVSGSLGLQTGGMLNSPFGDAMQGTILTA